jgi:hypothetical protein
MISNTCILQKNGELSLTKAVQTRNLSYVKKLCLEKQIDSKTALANICKLRVNSAEEEIIDKAMITELSTKDVDINNLWGKNNSILKFAIIWNRIYKIELF